MKRIVITVLLSVLLQESLVQAQQTSYDNAISKMQLLEGDAFRKAVDSVLLSLDVKSDYHLRQQVTQQVFSITKDKDELAHVRALTYLALYDTVPRPDWFYQAYQLAKKNKSQLYMNYVEERLSRYYMKEKQYDSAVLHMLRIRDDLQTPEQYENTQDLFNLMGDVYYMSGLYEDARTIYLSVLRQYEDKAHWVFWRPYVLMNNLGQISLMQKDYAEALRWFKLSRKRAMQYLHTADSTNIRAYIDIKLAETYLSLNHTDSATKYLKQALQSPVHELQEDVQQELLFVESKILLRNGEHQRALKLAQTLVPGVSLHFHHYRFVPQVYLQLASIWQKIGNPDSSLKYMSLYQQQSDSMANEGRKARSMILLAEKQHQNDKLNLAKYRQKYRIILAWLVTMVGLLLMMLVLYRKLYFSRLMLIRNQLTIIRKKVDDQQAVIDNAGDEDELRKQQELIKQLTQIMDKEKPYLDPRITIVHMSELLNTNRTYLSKAINKVLETNFSTYINDYRIQEAVGLIKTGFTVNHTIAALAEKSGFANRTVFYAVFKKHTGVTPAFFISNFNK